MRINRRLLTRQKARPEEHMGLLHLYVNGAWKLVALRPVPACLAWGCLKTHPRPKPLHSQHEKRIKPRNRMGHSYG